MTNRDKYDRQIRAFGKILHKKLQNSHITILDNNFIHMELFKNFLLLGVHDITISQTLLDNKDMYLKDFQTINEHATVRITDQIDNIIIVDGIMFRTCENCLIFWQIGEKTSSETQQDCNKRYNCKSKALGHQQDCRLENYGPQTGCQSETHTALKQTDRQADGSKQGKESHSKCSFQSNSHDKQHMESHSYKGNSITQISDDSGDLRSKEETNDVLKHKTSPVPKQKTETYEKLEKKIQKERDHESNMETKIEAQSIVDTLNTYQSDQVSVSDELTYTLNMKQPICTNIEEISLQTKSISPTQNRSTDIISIPGHRCKGNNSHSVELLCLLGALLTQEIVKMINCEEYQREYNLLDNLIA